MIGTASPALTNNTYLYIDGSNLKIFSDDPEDRPTFIPIHFCPLCGRNLDPEENE